MDDYRRLNHANWEARVPHHVAGYGLDRFHDDPEAISDVVRFDLPRLGSLDGVDVVHLQCHIGSDTLSLARLGARSVTGLDFSGAALDAARRLAVDTGAAIDYVEADVYDAVTVLGRERFDLVYTGIGALCWLPSIGRWASTVADLLRPGGRLFIREGHPMLWALDDPRDDGLLAVEYPYFETDGGVAFTGEKSYVEHEGVLEAQDTLEFNHGLAEIFNALWSAGLRIEAFEEHDTVPWPALGDQMEDVGGGEYRLIDRRERVACSYTLAATKKGPDELA